ncbi:MAG TPA: PilZ domain-containing protein [Candidatus Omnitrophota bacterium]|nr:PilZ domain-containing protein [Candidatus Omnitrophota bacterium]
MGQWEGLDRRQFPRVNYPCLVIINRSDDGDEKDNVILTHTDNIGIGGVCVVLKQSVKMFSEVDLELDLLDLGDHICCRGKVVWNVQRQREAAEKPLFFDIGIEFMNISPDNQARLKRIVDRLVRNAV